MSIFLVVRIDWVLAYRGCVLGLGGSPILDDVDAAGCVRGGVLFGDC